MPLYRIKIKKTVFIVVQFKLCLRQTYIKRKINVFNKINKALKNSQVTSINLKVVSI